MSNPTPWKYEVEIFPDRYDFLIRDAKGCIIFALFRRDREAEQTVKDIVSAVNSYAALVRAVETAEKITTGSIDNLQSALDELKKARESAEAGRYKRPNICKNCGSPLMGKSLGCPICRGLIFDEEETK